MCTHRFPLSPGRKTGATQATQVRRLEFGKHLVTIDLASEQAPQLREAGRRGVGQLTRLGLAAREQILNTGHTGVRQLPLTHTGRWRHMALADAGGFLHPHAGIARQSRAQIGQQGFTTGHGARQTGAHTHHGVGHGGVVVHDLEVVVEARHFEHLHLAQAQPFGQRGQVTVAQGAFTVLQAVQVFDQQVGTRCQPHAQGLDPRLCMGLHLASLGGVAWATSALRCVERANGDHGVHGFGEVAYGGIEQARVCMNSTSPAPAPGR